MKKLLLISLCIWTGLVAGMSESKQKKEKKRKKEKLARVMKQAPEKVSSPEKMDNTRHDDMEMRERGESSNRQMPCVDSSAEDMESEEEASPQVSQAPQEEEFKPFGGKEWDEVYITENAEHGHEIYAYYGDVIKKWDFGGYESREYSINREKISVNKDNCKKVYNKYFTDDYFYLKGSKNVLRYSMHDGFEEGIQMRGFINKLSTCRVGFAMHTKGYITAFDPQGNPKGDPIEVDEGKYKGMQMLDSGEIVHYDSDNLHMVDMSSGTEPKKVTLKYQISGIHPKKTVRGDLVLACTHKTIENQKMIQVMNTDNGQVEQSIPIKSYNLKLWAMNGNYLATGNGNKGSTVKLFDLERGQEIYSGIAKGIGGTCTFRLQDKLIYFVGDHPKPASTIIDTREKPACNG